LHFSSLQDALDPPSADYGDSLGRESDAVDRAASVQNNFDRNAGVVSASPRFVTEKAPVTSLTADDSASGTAAAQPILHRRPVDSSTSKGHSTTTSPTSKTHDGSSPRQVSDSSSAQSRIAASDIDDVMAQIMKVGRGY